MLDMGMFRENAEALRSDHNKRGLSHEAIDEVIRLDGVLKQAMYEMEMARKERNSASRAIADAKKSGDEERAQKVLDDVQDIGIKIEELDIKTDSLLKQRNAIRMGIPNILHLEVPIGDDEGGNTKHSSYGDKPSFDFKPRTHNDLIEMNGWVDLERGAKVAGSRFFFLKGDLARLEMALQSHAVDFLIQRGYTLVQPPLMMNRAAYEGVTDLADFETVMYGVEPDKLYMIATSEHPLTSMYMDEVIDRANLPLKLVGLSPCFRREVGAHGLSDRGIWRIHQFTKIEQIIIAHPDDSWELHEQLLQNCIDLWNGLGIHYEVVNICSGDMGTVAARKYDLDAWLPGAEAYKEIVSCSNCTDYQANRLKMRYRRKDNSHRSVHTLNSTAVATSRALVAIMEQYQLEDGRVKVPEVLQAHMGGQEILKPCSF